MKSARIAFGVLLLLLGTVWVGQGLGYIRGSFMTGSMRWFFIGAAVDVLGLALIVAPSLARKGPRRG